MYRARDTRLGREVAIKVSTAQFNERFEREARVIASLNHSNICTLFDVGPNYLVMEMVEGQTLAERIKDGAIPLEEALRIARQIGDALEAAHARSIVHRDLKPANVKIKLDGVVKVLDFGLAKGQASARDPENSSTVTMEMSEAGMILGTPGYMSPEQASGEAADKRADIWAFGVVLHEMLTGKRLFMGATMREILTAVVTREPDLELVPGKVRRLLKSCLEKDPKDRLRDIGDAWRLLEDTPPLAPRTKPASRLPWVAAAALAVVAAEVSFVHFREAAPEPQMLQYTLAAPEKTTIANFAVSPDGRALVIGANGEKERQLWVRSLNSLQAHPLAGTEGANYPFWSADSRFIGFFAQGKLQKIAAMGGPAQILCDAPAGRGGAWNLGGVIVFAPTNSGGLYRMSEAGGVAVQVTKPETGTHRYPGFLPDGRRFLYTQLGARENGIYLGSLGFQSYFQLLPARVAG